MRADWLSAGKLDICVIGAGPRGLSILERLCANARAAQRPVPTRVHLVDPYPPGAGQVWRTDQPQHLLMNTVAAQVTVFTDASVEMDGVLERGPSLFEWASFHALVGPLEGSDDQVSAEATALGPDSYPTRALYGRYLSWAFHRVVSRAPAHVTVAVHPQRAVHLDDGPDGRQVVRFADGSRLADLDAVVLAQGHVPTVPTPQEAALASFADAHGLVYVGPTNPADVDLSTLEPGQPVALRGLGLSFFDYQALLTLGRGGVFERRDGRLAYRPSGREPRLFAGSRRGVPYHCRGENEKGAAGRHEPKVLTGEVIERLRRTAARSGLDFRRDLWPLIAKEVETVYYTALLQVRGRLNEARQFRTAFLACPPGSTPEQQLLDAFELSARSRWDWDRVARPYGGRHFANPAAFRTWLLAYLRRDVYDAKAGNVTGPRKAALDVLRDLRNEIRLLVDHGGLTGRSHRDDLERWYTPLNAFLSIGPPIRRIEEMTALIEAGVLQVLGPSVRVRTDGDRGRFVLDSALVPGNEVNATALIEARLPDPDVRRTTDPLLRHLLDTGQAGAYRIADASGSYETGGLHVTERPYFLVDTRGRAHPRRFAFGVPTESVHWVTAAGARPGVNSVTLGDSDAIARAVLSLAEAPVAIDRMLPGDRMPAGRPALAGQPANGERQADAER